MSAPDKTLGEQLVADSFPADGKPWSKSRALLAASAIEVAIAAGVQRGFRLGFEHAVAGGEEAKGIFKSRGMFPLVMYFADEAGRNEMIDAVHLAKPGMAEVKIPE